MNDLDKLRLSEIDRKLATEHQLYHEDSEWLIFQIDKLEKANESLTFQLQDRIKLEHDQEGYFSAARRSAVWAQQCAALTRKVYDLEQKLKGK